MDPRVDSRAAWLRLMVALGLMTIGSSAMYVVSVVLPAVQAEFGVARADASLPYTAMMIGFGLGGIVMGRLSDRFGVMVPLLIGSVGLAVGFYAASRAGSVWSFSLVHGVLLGLLGSSATFAPLVADTALWFERRRGIAVAICASGNYLAGALWPPIVQRIVDTDGWRHAYLLLAVVCAVTLPLLALCMRTRPPVAAARATAAAAGGDDTARHGRSASRSAPRRRCFAWPVWPAVWRCRCRRCTSSPTAATSASARRVVPRCFR